MLTLGVPIHVRGISPMATMTIQLQSPSLNPAASTKLPVNWEMRTMNTQPPPYSVNVMEIDDSILQI